MIYFKQTISATEAFHFKPPRLGFSFLPPVSLEIILCRFSSRISIFPTIDWPLKSDYSSLSKSWRLLDRLSLNYVKRMRVKDKVKVSSLISVAKERQPKVEKSNFFAQPIKLLTN